MSDGSAEFDVVMSGVDDVSAPANSADASLQSLSEQLNYLNQSADGTNHQLGEMSENVGEAGDKAASTGLSVSDLNQGFELVNKTLGYAQKAYEQTIGKSQEYAEEVRNLKGVSGESAESTSRFIQVLDDYQISADDALTATKALTKQGYAPTTDTLAKLSGEYLSLNTVEEKNAFVTKNLGKAGLEWVNVLQQGPDAIRKQSAAVNENLILNEKSLKQAEQLRLAQDQLNDTWEGLSITLGTKLTPATSAWAALLDSVLSGNAIGKWGEDIQRTNGLALIPAVELLLQYGDTFNGLQEKMDTATTATQTHTEAVETDNAVMQVASEQNTNYLREIENASKAEEDYNKKHADLIAERVEVEAQLANTPVWDTEKAQGFRDKLEDISAKEAQLAADREKDQKVFLQQQIEKILSIDGLSKAELDYLIERGEKEGLYQKGTADQLNAALADAQKAVDEQKAIEAKGLEERTASWGTWKDQTKGMLDEVIGKGDEYIGKIGEIPPNVETLYGSNAVEEKQKVDDYLSSIKAVPNEVNTTFNAILPPTGNGGESVGADDADFQAPGFSRAVRNGQNITYITYNIQTAIISKDHEIIEML